MNQATAAAAIGITAGAGQPGLRAVLFDLGGTISRGGSPPRWREPWLRYAQAVDPVRADTIADRLLDAEEEAGRICQEAGQSCTFGRVLDAAGAPWSARAVTAYRACWRPYVKPVPGALDVLARLRADGLKLALVSNTIWPLAWHRGDLIGTGVLSCLDTLVLSSMLPVAKPHPAIFLVALARLGGVPPEQAVHVGDRLFEDVAGASRAGLRTVLVAPAPPPESASTGQRARPDGWLPDLSGLPGLLDRWRAEPPANETGGVS